MTGDVVWLPDLMPPMTAERKPRDEPAVVIVLPVVRGEMAKKDRRDGEER